MLSGKKRYIVLGLLAVELASLPAAAQIMHRVAFDIRPVVTAVEIPTAEPGVSRFLVASNSGFGVEAQNIVGDIKVSVSVSGTIGSVSRYGDAAQLPGAKTQCSQANGLTSPLYIADRKTAAQKGTPPEQAVVFEFQYTPEARPQFTFKPGAEAINAPLTCTNKTA